MRTNVVEIRHNKAAGQRTLGLDKGLRDALADHWRQRWPTNAAKLGAREYDLSLDEARGVVAGRTSLATIERIIKHKNGGWPLIVCIMAEVTGQTVEHYIIETRKSHEENAARLGAIVGSFGALPHRRSFTDPDMAGRSDNRRGRGDDRAAER